MERVYNKLVRDRIPEKIKRNGEQPITKVLSDKEYKIELEKKLLEEYNEVINCDDRKERIEELADMLEVIIALARLENNSLEDVIDITNKKREERGGFDDKIYLEKVIS